MPWVGSEPTIPVFARVKIFHALNRAATVIGRRGVCSSFHNGIKKGSMLTNGVNISAVIDLCDVRRRTNEFD
jgi:hypothetical protein